MRHGSLALAVFVLFLLIVFGGLIWDTSAQFTEQRVRYDESVRKRTSDVDERINQECAGEVDHSAMWQCVRNSIEAIEAPWLSRRDLEAQELMARFTRIMGWTGLIGLGIGSGSVYLIWRTLRETRRLANDTRDIGERQVRAYVDVENIAVNDLEIGKIPFVTFILKNSGASPARNLSVKTLMGTSPDPNRFKVYFGDISEGSRTQISATSAYDQVRRFSVPADEQSMKQIQSGNAELFIAGVVVYDDVFGVKRRTIFRSRLPLENIVGSKGILVTCNRNNRSS